MLWLSKGTGRLACCLGLVALDFVGDNSDGSHSAFGICEKSHMAWRKLTRHKQRSTAQGPSGPGRSFELLFFVKLCTSGILKEATLGLEKPKPAVEQRTVISDSHICVYRLHLPQRLIRCSTPWDPQKRAARFLLRSCHVRLSATKVVSDRPRPTLIGQRSSECRLSQVFSERCALSPYACCGFPSFFQDWDGDQTTDFCPGNHVARLRRREDR